MLHDTAGGGIVGKMAADEGGDVGGAADVRWPRSFRSETTNGLFPDSLPRIGGAANLPEALHRGRRQGGTALRHRSPARRVIRFCHSSSDVFSTIGRQTGTFRHTENQKSRANCCLVL